ncbi:Class II abasic (AP) endonuclease [Exophiala dermatitidis]|uniref:DNA-(apurinic or apyrimidinic site) endonuclease 2 n=1 Tax=Exophiala dermatitidis TaxID=5970 RepID=A0AAN6F2B9_EXODE|nr:Class II abasic (AP) endonuclease [Exophiala dermatitidis]KAJ4527935.1 Class II abasic (AP) endonuclease [Exophiala dermatitidis]KAJ4528569.1 Class II abasic (AP) endonuclease [Exophiala dermatitidis]KAJ4529941.1 Class II abasic (AP) endonuclease [Exophiala dermatitidis]KAJ4552923.1 Class II abasic (AP) endonuclease [Exophiala dermatitidis]
MGIRITTWNVNGIRNPFGYQPWRDKKTFAGMFDTLEADIVVFQETKIQRKDLRDDMVLVPGWDNYWSLPKHKKGYSGVVIYTRNATCAPIRAEEGITGILTSPNSSTAFRDLPVEEQIGGYPSIQQLPISDHDPASLDSEGRCVILEFPAFVLIGTYCPAERDETRTHFRTSFLNVLDARIRNLVKMGKRVVWVGDMNISREEIDTAAAEESMRKHGIDAAEWISTPARRMLNQLLVGGKVHGERDEGRETAIMWDVCRAFHEGRRGMYTCWETKVNARPGNYGSRIDYIICSHDMRDWWSDANIQEGLLGSDHCPVYAVLKDKVLINGKETHVLDLMNPPGMFVEGVRQREWTTKCLLPLSGKLIQEFYKRQSIKDMLTRQPTLQKSKSTIDEAQGVSTTPPSVQVSATGTEPTTTPSQSDEREAVSKTDFSTCPSSTTFYAKRKAKTNETLSSVKRSKSASISTPNGSGKGQQSLKGFFAAKPSTTDSKMTQPPEHSPQSGVLRPASIISNGGGEATNVLTSMATAADATTEALSSKDGMTEGSGPEFISTPAPSKTKHTWGKLFSRPVAPKCEHDEPCKIMVTKKPGVNCGRSFWMCNRPLGPSGKQEKGTQWRCNTFIWASDWDTHTPAQQ